MNFFFLKKETIELMLCQDFPVRDFLKDKLQNGTGPTVACNGHWSLITDIF